MRKLRGLGKDAKENLIARGPGRLAAALGLELVDDGQNLLRGTLTLHAPEKSQPAPQVLRGPRVGITQAVDLPDRFFEADSP
jgi:DNA-3-methyladenine glycosylase